MVEAQVLVVDLLALKPLVLDLRLRVVVAVEALVEEEAAVEVPPLEEDLLVLKPLALVLLYPVVREVVVVLLPQALKPQMHPVLVPLMTPLVEELLAIKS